MPGRPDAHHRHAALAASAAIAGLLLLPTPFAAAAPTAALQQNAIRCAVPSMAPSSGVQAVGAGAAPTAAPDSDDSPVIRRATEPAPPAPVASPVGRPPLSDESLTPVATPRPATPASTPDPQDVFATELRSVADALAACLSDGTADTVLDLATESYLGQLYAGGAPLTADEYLALAPAIAPAPVRIIDLEDARGRGTETATATVTSVVGNQLLREEWRFVQRPAADRAPGASVWQVDGAETLSAIPPRGATPLAVTLAEYSIAIADPSSGPDAILTGTNLGAEDHEMLVLRFDPGFTTGDLMRAAGPALPDDVQWVGQATIPAGATAELVLTGLEPGTYTVVCLLPTVRGTPHLALGMAATFAVE